MNRIYNSLRYRFWHFVHFHFPYFWAKHIYKEQLGKKVNLTDPKDINEKIIWLEYFTDTRLWSQLADKYAVREYVQSRVGGGILIPLLGRWTNVDDIDFDSLPDRFILKPNNGSYNTIIVRDKSRADLDDIRKRLKLSLENKFGLDNAEYHYLRIKPCIIAEKLLETDEPQGLVDYKIWCFNGKPFCFFLGFDRDPETHRVYYGHYDLQWNKHPELIAESFRNDCSCPKPENFEKLLALASQLSEGLPQCRVDMYDIKGEIYFGEMTLTSNYGMMPFYTQELLDDMGRQCKLPKRTFTDRWRSFLTRYMPVLG